MTWGALCKWTCRVSPWQWLQAETDLCCGALHSCPIVAPATFRDIWCCCRVFAEASSYLELLFSSLLAVS